MKLAMQHRYLIQSFRRLCGVRKLVSLYFYLYGCTNMSYCTDILTCTSQDVAELALLAIL